MNHPFALTIADLESLDLALEEVTAEAAAKLQGGSCPGIPLPSYGKPPIFTTLALGEEGGDVTTLAIGEEGGDF